jgi:hypothetical protein
MFSGSFDFEQKRLAVVFESWLATPNQLNKKTNVFACCTIHTRDTVALLNIIFLRSELRRRIT